MDISEIIQKGKQAGISPEKTLQILQKNGVDISSYNPSYSSQLNQNNQQTTKIRGASGENTALGRLIKGMVQGVAHVPLWAANQLYAAGQGINGLFDEEAGKKFLQGDIKSIDAGYLGSTGPADMMGQGRDWETFKKSVGMGIEGALTFLPGGALAKAGEVAGGKAAVSYLSSLGRAGIEKIPFGLGDAALASNNIVMRGAKSFMRNALTGTQIGGGIGLAQGLENNENVIGIIGDILKNAGGGALMGGALGTGLSAGGKLVRGIKDSGVKGGLQNAFDKAFPITKGVINENAAKTNFKTAKDLGVGTPKNALNYLENAAKDASEFTPDKFEKSYQALNTIGKEYNSLAMKENNVPKKLIQGARKFEKETGISLGDTIVADSFEKENPVTWGIDKYGLNEINVDNYKLRTSKMNEALIKQLESVPGDILIDDIATQAEANIKGSPAVIKRNKLQLKEQIEAFREKYGEKMKASDLKKELTNQWDEAYSKDGTVVKDVNKALGDGIRTKLINMAKEHVPIEHQLKILQSREIYGKILNHLNGAKAPTSVVGRNLSKAVRILGAAHGPVGTGVSWKVGDILQDMFRDPSLRTSTAIQRYVKEGKITSPLSSETFINDASKRAEILKKIPEELQETARQEYKQTNQLSSETSIKLKEAIEEALPKPPKTRLSNDPISGLSHLGIADEIKSLGGDINAIAEWLNGLGLSEELIQKYSPSLSKMKTLASIRSIIERIKNELSNVSNVIE